MLDAFVTADDVLRQAIQGISDLILVPGLINLDFADVKTIMSGMGVAMMGTAMAEGQTRATDAANRAISSPLLEDASVDGARGVIINVTGGPDMSLMEVNEALTIIQEAAHEDANIILARSSLDLRGVKIAVIATGFDLPPNGDRRLTAADARRHGRVRVQSRAAGPVAPPEPVWAAAREHQSPSDPGRAPCAAAGQRGGADEADGCGRGRGGQPARRACVPPPNRRVGSPFRRPHGAPLRAFGSPGEEERRAPTWRWLGPVRE
jgi:hypothetical protein